MTRASLTGRFAHLLGYREAPVIPVRAFVFLVATIALFPVFCVLLIVDLVRGERP